MPSFRTLSFGTQNKSVVFMLSGWHTRFWMFWLFAKILELNGFQCILYEYDDDVLSPNTQKTVKSLLSIRDDILHKIEVLKKDGCTEFSIFGTSLGSNISLLVANRSKDISHVILNTTGIDIAETIWSWQSVFPYFKEMLLKNNYTLERLQEEWKPISPRHNIDNLKNKDILVYVSKKDEIIPYYLGKQLLEAFKERNYSYKTIVNTQLNHFFTGVYNLFNCSIYSQFLKKKIVN